MMHVRISTPLSRVNTSLQSLVRQVVLAHNWEILQILARASCSVRHLADELELGEAEISRSLRLMRDFGIVESHAIKKYHFYALNGLVELSMRDEGGLRLFIEWDDKTSFVIELGETPPSAHLADDDSVLVHSPPTT